MEGEYWWSLVNFDICIEIESEGDSYENSAKKNIPRTFFQSYFLLSHRPNRHHRCPCNIYTVL